MLYVAGAAMGSVYKLTHLSLHLYQLQQMLEKYFEHFMSRYATKIYLALNCPLKHCSSIFIITCKHITFEYTDP